VYPKYSVKTIRPTVVLEIEVSELKSKLNSFQLSQLTQWHQEKQAFRLKRMARMLRVARRHFDGQTYRKFHDEVLKSILVLHPNASKMILTKLGNH